jgi:photoactive yellow protein
MLATTSTDYRFETIALGALDGLTGEQRDILSFGVIGLGADFIAEIYNATESRLAGISPARVLGSQFFLNIGICMNNYLVAQRFEDEPELDTIIDYVLTLRMRPTPVRLRLLQSPSIARRYILTQR